MLVPIYNLGQFGVLKDLPPADLPLNAWSDALNMSFDNNVARKTPGYSTLLASATGIPRQLFVTPGDLTNFWAYFTLNKAYGFLGSGSETDITRATDYTGGEVDLWNGGMFQGLGIFNNGVDNPQLWSPVSLSQDLVDLPNWPASTKAKVLKGFKNYLVALDVTKGSARYRRMIKWSHTAAPGTIPTSWDETDQTKDAGEIVLSEGEDEIIDCEQLGNYNVIYTKLQTWLQSLSGTRAIFNFDKRFDASGILAQNCAKVFRRRHFVVTQDDIIIHDGTQIESRVDSRLRSWIFNNLTSTAYRIARVIPFYRRGEMWFCFPFQGTGLLNMAVIWNWKFDTWTIRELPDIRAISSSMLNPGDAIDLFDVGSSGSFDTWPGQFGVETYSPSQEAVFLGTYNATGTNKILQLDDANYTADGVNYRSFVERTGLPVAGLSKDSQVIINRNVVKMLVGVWPDIEAADGTEIIVRAGSQDNSDDAISWTDPVTFIVGTNVKVDLYRTGRFLSLRYEATGSAPWALRGHSLDVVPLGML